MTEQANISTRLSQLRESMKENNIDYYFVPTADPHNNEYVPEHWQRRAWISNFTGSAGNVLVGLEQAYLWTDPRYFLQAEMQLDDSLYNVMRNKQVMAPPIDAWLKQHTQNISVGVDPRVISAA